MGLSRLREEIMEKVRIILRDYFSFITSKMLKFCKNIRYYIIDYWFEGIVTNCLYQILISKIYIIYTFFLSNEVAKGSG